MSEPGKGKSFQVYLPITKVKALMLERLGYAVSTRTSSSDALELFKTNPSAYDLVITEMSMPQMTGQQLAKELLAIYPKCLMEAISLE